MKCLDRVDHAHLGPLLLERREHGLEVGLRDHGDPQRGALAQPLRPQTDLRRRFLSRDVERPPAGRGEVRQRHRRQRRLPDARRAADQDQRPRDDAAAQHSVELADARAQPRLLARDDVGQLHRLRRGDCAPPSAGRSRCAGAGDARPALLYQRVPLATAGAAPGPARTLVAAGGADVDLVRTGHCSEATRWSRRHQGSKRPLKQSWCSPFGFVTSGPPPGCRRAYSGVMPGVPARVLGRDGRSCRTWSTSQLASARLRLGRSTVVEWVTPQARSRRRPLGRYPGSARASRRIAGVNRSPKFAGAPSRRRLQPTATQLLPARPRRAARARARPRRQRHRLRRPRRPGSASGRARSR